MAHQLAALYDGVERDLTAPGGAFETEIVLAHGREVRAFRRAPVGINEFWRLTCERHHDRVLTWYEGERLTYADVADRAARLAGFLRHRFAVGPGDRVGIAMANRPDYYVALLAAAHLGAVAVMINSRGLASDLTGAVARTHPHVVVTDARRAALLIDVGVPVLVAGADATGSADALSLDTVIESADPVNPVRDDPDRAAWILFTSGTSGTPKGAVLTQRNIGNLVATLEYSTDLNVEVQARAHGVDADRIRGGMTAPSVLLVYPLFHVSGLTGTLAAMIGGGQLVILPRWDAARAAELISAHTVTQVSGPPMILQDLLDLPEATTMLSSVRSVGAGGQATPADLTTRLRELLPAAAQGVGWGMTEVSGGVASIADPLFAEAPTAVGRAHPIIDIRTVQADTVLPVGTVGELEVRGALVMDSYWEATEATEEAFHDGWYRTGDIGRVDGDGLVYILDRKKDMVISGGENIYCAEVEHALYRTGIFTEVAVFGVPDPRSGERVVAAVTTRDGVELDQAAVQGLAAQELAPYKVPSVVVFDLGPFPRNGTGKVLKSQIRTSYLTR